MNIEPQDEKSSYRKPYQPEMPATWWQKMAVYRKYILRESTSVLMIWFSLLILYGLTTINTDEFYNFIFFVRHPVVIAINAITLLAALYHSITWFNLAPKAMNVVVKDRKLPALIPIMALWILTIVASVVLFMIVVR
ncbi:fumarate reductase subunit C [Zophobihabitans entericus]|uniref:Fumarate reductase subunit C n=1 Tax=Zophobihabitans entericus TaxID=1635327 RepID=A0A6G9IB23_9GAMM|nr:fumarate reductase subunit C [Zophobihabitans entericus]QIQ20780.1 fumarate reductase subunit C [Zophobihabitans entericus]